MPIDYSKFDNIDSDDEDDVPAAQPARGGPGQPDMNELLRMLQEMGDKEKAGGAAGGKSAPGRRAGAGGFDSDFGLADRYESEDRKEVDVETMRKVAWQHLLARLVVRPGAASVARALLLEGEVHLISHRYKDALISALALQLLLQDEEEEGECTLDRTKWSPPVGVIEMVSSYQLGDRERAVELRDVLRKCDLSSLSAHLKKRFEGTSEVLDLVPQFLNLVKQSEQAER
eukprot:TRINITY_DN122225_c0_g1_i1.p2 TRINITY_DN122225_c0_g1~~TRINITY_DN122225_c0_g1_i1.p2  ORF type:complete len:230 (-),score=78.03 TRINITY_DN122225_c0_g1_i1:108-797(-)